MTPRDQNKALSRLGIECLVNKEPVTRGEMVSLIATYTYDSGITREFIPPSDYQHYFSNDKELLRAFCQAKKFYFQCSNIENHLPLERYHVDDLEEGNIYWNREGTPFVYSNKKLHQVPMTERELKSELVSLDVSQYDAESKIRIFKA